MTANTTVDILKYTAAATPKTNSPKASGANSYADTSGNFTSILDRVKKNYTDGRSSTNNANTASSNAANNNSTNTKALNNKTDDNNKTNNTQNAQQTDSTKNTQEKNQTDNNADSTKTATTAQEPVSDNTQDTEKAIASSEAKTDAAEAAADASEAKTAAAADDAAEDAKTASDVKSAIDEKAAAKTKASDDANTKIIANSKDEQQAILDAKAIADAQADACANNKVADTNTAALETAATTNEADTKSTSKSDSTDKNEKINDAEDTDKNEETSAKTDTNVQTAIDLTMNTLSKAVENVVASLPQAVNTANNDKSTDANTNNVQSVQATDKSEQEDIKINTNAQLNQITSPKDITAKELNNINIPSKIQLNSQQDANTELAANQPTTETEVSEVQNTNTDTPVIKVSTEAVISDINLNSHIKDTSEKQTAKNNASASITQEILDKTNAKITSVQGENTSDSGSNNLLSKQHAGEQAIKFAIENDRNDKENTQNITQSIGVSTQDVDLTNIAANTTPQAQQNTSTNFAKALEGVQTPVEPPKELNKSDILSQINNKLGDLKDEGTTKINIILRPENLGKLNLELVTTKEGFTAQITADSAHVKELLDKNLDSLKDTLGSQGVNVNNVSVKVAESPKQDSTNYFEQQNQNNQNNQQQSNNKQSSGQGFSFNDEANNFSDMTEASSESEDLTSANIDDGKIDYKV